jgi:transcriptional regulator with XRE-family HTH domain
MTIEDAFATVLRDLRTAKGLTQERLAFDADLDRTFISLLERGHRQPSLGTLFQLSEALGVSPASVVQRVEELLAAAP